MANNFDGIITNPPRTGMSFTPVIDVSNWKENLSEMHGLKGNEGVLNIPHSIGKSEMQEIANNLGKARESFKELEHTHDEYHQELAEEKQLDDDVLEFENFSKNLKNIPVSERFKLTTKS